MRHFLIATLFVLFLVGSLSTPSYAVSIVLPPTGQATCQDMDGLTIPCAGTGQDGELRKGVVLSGERFTVNSHVDGDSVTDNLTTLVWAKDANLLLNRDPSFDTDGFGPEPDGLISTKTALAYMEKLNAESFGGYNDWRIPNRNELMSLIDTEHANPALPTGHPFLNVQNNVYGTNSADKGRPVSFTWLVNMKSGTVGTGYSDSSLPVNFWPVRGGSWSGPVGKAYLPATNQKLCYDYSSYSSSPVPCATTSGQDGNLQKGVAWPDPRFSDLGDGSVHDTLTNLVWPASSNTPGPVACNPGVDRTWGEAFSYIACLNTNAYLGASNWRMPNRNELASLSYIEGEFPPANHPFDVNNSYFLFHSSTPVAADSSTVGELEERNAWTVRMDGWVSMQGKSAAYPVWPVRDAPVIVPDSTPPEITDFTLPANSISTTVTISAFTATDNIGVTGYCARTVNNPTGCFWTATPPTSYDFGSVGSKTLYAFARDAAGNISTVATATITIILPVSGSCGTAHNAFFLVSPATGLCSQGTPSDVTGTGPWSWSCQGTIGGTVAECTAQMTIAITIPRTGQGSCFASDGTDVDCFASGQDGDIRAGSVWPAQRFTENGDGTINDSLTGLNWTTHANLLKVGAFGGETDGTAGDGYVTWQHALDFVKNMNQTKFYGYNDWRLPNINELQSLADSAFSFPAISPGHPFLNIEPGADLSYWSSTSSSSNPTQAMAVGLNNNGKVIPLDKASMAGAWVLRGTNQSLGKTGQFLCFNTAGTPIDCNDTDQDGELKAGVNWPTVRFADNGNQTVTDLHTSLVWSIDAATPGPAACNPAVAKAWQDALDHVACLNTNQYLGFTDWRLPNRLELTSLYNRGVANSASWLIDSGFTSVQTTLYWSGTTSVDQPASAFSIFFGINNAVPWSKAGFGWVWPVRGGSVIDDIAPVVDFALPTTTDSSTVSITTFTASDNVAVTGYMLTESPTPPSSADPGWSATAPTSYTFTGLPNGSTDVFLYAWAKDAAGNVSGEYGVMVTIFDTIPPVISEFILPTFSSTTMVTFFAFTATDNIGVTGYCARNINDPAGCLWSASPPTSYDFGSPGSKTLYAFARDAAGNISVTVPRTVFIDVMLPWVTSFVLPATSTSFTVPVTTLTGADDDQIAGYLINQSGVAPTANDPAWKATVPSSFTISGNTSGSYDLYAYVKDRAGNVSPLEETGWAPVVVDRYPPVITTFTMPEYYGSPTLTVPITLNFSDADNLGVNSVCFTETNDVATCNWQFWSGVLSHTFATAGAKTLYAFVADFAGTVSTVASKTTTVTYFLPIAIPRTGQTIRHASGDDGSLMAGKAWPEMRFFDNRDGTVTDKLTTLVWSQSANTPTVPECGGAGFKNWVDSLNHITCLNTNNYLGYSDWRLPNINELSSLLDFNRNNLSVNSTVAPGLDPNDHTLLDLLPPEPMQITRYFGFWSSTIEANNNTENTNNAWALSAQKTTFPRNVELDVWPVRGGLTYDQQGQAYVPGTGKTFSISPGDDGAVRAGVPLPVKENRFVVNGGLTTDRFTNLIWPTHAATPTCGGLQSPATWPQALDLIACLNRTNYAGFSDWRLPNVRELDSISKTPGDPLYGEGVYIEHSSSSYFSIGQNNVYWSSNSFLNQTTRAWAVNVTTGWHTNYDIDAGDQFDVWPVRGGIFTDTEKPVITAFTLPLVSQGTFSITSLTATDNMVVTRYCVIEDPSPNLCNMVYPAPTTFTLSGGFGVRTLYAFAIDARNNISNPVSATILIDSVPPVITLFSLQATSGNLTVPVLFAVDTLTGIADFCLTEGADTSSCVWNAGLPTSYTFSHSGENVLHAFARDTAGNISEMATASITIPVNDNTPPVVTFALPATAATATVAISTFTASDNIAVTGYMLTETAAPPTAGNAGWVVTAPTSYTFSGIPDAIATPKTLFAWTKDAAGNISAVQSATVTITIPDTTAPIISFALPATSSAAIISISTFTASDNVAVTGYRLTESATPPAAGAAGWRATAPASYTFSGLTVGITDKTLYAWAKDAAGNVSAVTSAGVSITIALLDTLAPSINFNMISLSAPLTVPVVQFTASDMNGVTGYCLTESSDPATCSWQETAPGSYTFSAYGTTTIYAYARDAFGNIGSSSRAIILSDMMPPSVVTFAAGNATNSLTVSITSFTASDNGTLNGYCVAEVSDPGSCIWQPTAPTNYTFSTYGDRLLYAFVRDLAGNVSAARSDLVSVIDNSLPFVSNFTVTGTAASLMAQVTAFTATDNDRVSGYCIVEINNSAGCTWQATPHTSYTFATVGPKSLYAFVRDPSGNIGFIPQRTVTVGDSIPPATPAVTVQLPATSATVTITSFTSTDNVGVSGYCLTEINSSTGCNWTATPPTHYSFLNVPEGVLTSRTLYAWAKDAFNNTSSPRTVGVPFSNLPDTTAPIISGFTLLGNAGSLTISVTLLAATDNIAVTAYCISETNSPDGCVWQATPPTDYTVATEGNKTLYAFATDAVGNITSGVTASVNITLQPVRIGGPTPVYYPTLQGAYNIAATSNVIQLKAGSLTSDLLANRDVTVTLEGGAYATSTPNTVIRGVVRISAGKVVANKIAIAP